ncbi:MAG: putative signal transducing protein [Candidatus Angelobacter sp.]
MSTQAKSDPELVGVFETEQESEAMVVHGLLTSAGIESVVTSIDAPQNIFPGVGGVVVRVNAAQAEDARRLIDEYQNSPDSVEEVELDDSGEPAPE